MFHRKSLTLFFLFFILGIAVYSSYYIYKQRRFAQPREILSIESPKDSLLRIAILGDSWVSYAKLDSAIKARLKNSPYNCMIKSYGIPGAKTKLIYQRMFPTRSGNYISEKILSNDIDICVVVAGVNDACTHMGADYYSYHMTLIIKSLLERKIYPVVITLPEFGIEEEFYTKPLLNKMKAVIYRYMFDKGKVNIINEYRQNLLTKLHDEKLINKIKLLDFEKVIDEYYNNRALYSNPNHLSDEGSKMLGKNIADAIVNTVKVEALSTN